MYGLDGCPPHRAEHCLGEEAELAGETLCRRWVEDAGVQHLANYGLELEDAAPCRLDCDAPVAELDMDALDHLFLGRRLGLARLGLEAQVAEDAAEGVEGGVGELVEIHGVKIIHIVAAEEEDQRCRGRRRRGRCFPRPGAVPSRQNRRRCGVWARRLPMVALCPDRRQSLPRRSLTCPCSSSCTIGKDAAARNCSARASRSTSQPLMWGKATVWHGQSAGALNRPTTLPKRCSSTSQFVQQLLGVFRRGGALQPALHILPATPTDVLDVLGVVAPAVGAFAPPRARPHLAHHVEAVGEVVGDAVHVGIVQAS